ncbi:MAG: carbohydrate ABC transporter permease [Spirochaetia bacterium]|nr:carbohydrate ABC transporter permease [Spirochaetia bacterium]MCF7945975.1 carbohydrate ABC transporter permease [Spirochaetia bacterium]
MKKHTVKNIYKDILILIAAIIMAFPFLYLIKLSLQPTQDVMQLPILFIPSSLHFENLWKVNELIPVLRFFNNTVLYAVSTTVLTITTGTMAAYALAKLDLPGSKLIMLCFISSVLLPPEIRAIPMYTLVSGFGWIDTWKGMIIPMASTGFSIFFLYQYLITIPTEILESARIDGASELRIMVSIAIPMSVTAIASMALYNFLFRWRGFIWPLIMTRGKVTTLSVGLSQLKTGEQLTQWNMIASATMYTFIPALLLFLFLRKYIFQAISMNLK